MSESLVLVERDEFVVVVQLNRLKQLNALSDDLMEELVQRLQELDRDGIRCIVLAGSERPLPARTSGSSPRRRRSSPTTSVGSSAGTRF